MLNLLALLLALSILVCHSQEQTRSFNQGVFGPNGEAFLSVPAHLSKKTGVLCFEVETSTFVDCVLLPQPFVTIPPHALPETNSPTVKLSFQHTDASGTVLHLLQSDYFISNSLRDGPSVVFTSPEYGEIVSIPKVAGEAPQIESIDMAIYFSLFSNGCSIGSTCWVSFQVSDQETFKLDNPTDYLSLSGVEPGTQSLEAQVVDRWDRPLGPVSTVLFDVVLTPDSIARHSQPVQRNFHHPAPTVPTLAAATATAPSPLQRAPIRILFVGMLKFDGQKTIWLRQMECLDRTRFRIEYMTFLDEQPTDEPLQSKIRNLGIPLHREPLPPVSYAELDAHFGTAKVTPTTQAELNPLLIHALDIAGNDLSAIPAGFLRRTWQHIVDHIRAVSPDILVFANARDESDVLLSRAARLAGVKSIVMELPNLFPVTHAPVDVYIAPSHYVATHPSVSASGGGRVQVIPPAVNVTQYDPAAPAEAACPHSTRSRVTGAARCGGPCVVVGFLARLSPEKSVGLFVHAAAVLSSRLPFVRFVVIGDGAIRRSLEAMARVYGVASRFHFTGGVYSDLPRHLAGVDILVNPSLRAWSETFCIANIEAMAMAIPVVSFGVGGVQEYLQPGWNGVLVQKAEPMAMVDAIGTLVLNGTLRRTIGARARQTVLHHFNLETQLAAYSTLYDDLSIKHRHT